MLCLWEWGTLPRLGSVHPPMGGSELSPSPSLNVSPLCKGLPGQVGLPGEIGVPGPKVRGGGECPQPQRLPLRGSWDQWGKPHRVCGHPLQQARAVLLQPGSFVLPPIPWPGDASIPSVTLCLTAPLHTSSGSS